jgi:hypothetical protein
LVRPADHELRRLLAAATVVFIGAVALANLLGAGGLFLLVSAGLGALVLLFLPMLRQATHPYSGAAFVRFAVAVLVFQVWNAAAFWVILLSSTRGLAAGIIQATAALPLLAGLAWMSRR